ncbi:MAG: NUDIX domain-containing protein [Chitinivibrionales bacterium]|nr:NUDIX domain-containing protein [Chitinivibrionales bacterium]
MGIYVLQSCFAGRPQPRSGGARPGQDCEDHEAARCLCPTCQEGLQDKPEAPGNRQGIPGGCQVGAVAAPQYRKGVCIVLRRQTGTKVLVCHRINSPPDLGWQFPQGGVHDGVPLLDEARRELREEIGTDDVRAVAHTRRVYCYDIPVQSRRPGSPYVGQCHRWVLAYLLADDSAIRFTHEPAEFDAFRWVEPHEALERIVAFKREAYEGALTELGLVQPAG